jgi:hypothetical protein
LLNGLIRLTLLLIGLIGLCTGKYRTSYPRREYNRSRLQGQLFSSTLPNETPTPQSLTPSCL